LSQEFKRGCHAVACGVDFADEPIIKITQPTNIAAVMGELRRRAGYNLKVMPLIAIRPRGTCKWTLYKFWRPIMRHHELDYLRMRAVLEDL